MVLYFKTVPNTVYREFFVSRNFGENNAWKVCYIFTESYFRYFKDSQWRQIVGFIFSLCLFLAISGRSRTQRKLNPHDKFPIYGKWYLLTWAWNTVKDQWHINYFRIIPLGTYEDYLTYHVNKWSKRCSKHSYYYASQFDEAPYRKCPPV